MRAAPSDFTNWKKACTAFHPNLRALDRARYSARFAQFMVSVRLIPATETCVMRGRQGNLFKRSRKRKRRR
jgi:hypothetical protein